MSDAPTIKAIETRYKGFRFRSRLEARWAVFLDTLGVKWEYEAEGYKLEVYRYVDDKESAEELWYLPDFWLPDWEVYIEVKPAGVVDEVASEKAANLAYETSKPVIVLAGQPWPYEYDAWLFDHEWLPNASGYFCQCAGSQTYWLRSKDRGDDWAILLDKKKAARFNSDGRARWAWLLADGGQLPAAFNAARSARFERGK